MRITCLAQTLLALSLMTSALQAQPSARTPAETPKVDPAKDTLDQYLMHWEAAMKKVESLAVACNRTEHDKVYQTKKTYTGTIHFVKPTMFFWNMQVKDKPGDWERFVCTGQYIYQYVPGQKEIRVYPAPKTNGEGKLANDSSLAFLFGMKATEAKARYDLKLHQVDGNYVYIDVTAKQALDRADFTKARVVLNKDSYLPRQIWFEHPNSGEVLWDIPNMQPNVKIDRKVFDAPQAPKDWKMVRGDAAATGKDQNPPPRVVRPKNDK